MWFAVEKGEWCDFFVEQVYYNAIHTRTTVCGVMCLVVGVAYASWVI